MHSANSLFDHFRSEGYKTFVILKGARSRVWFTKEEFNESLFGEPFSDETQFDEFKLENDFEKEVFKIFPRNTFIKLGE